MPFQSEAQRKWMYAAEKDHRVKKGTAARWQKETGKKRLPMHKRKSKGRKKTR